MQNENNAEETPQSEQPDAADIRRGVNLNPIGRLSFLRRHTLVITVVAALTLALSAGVSAGLVKAMQPDYVVFDMKGTIDTFRQQTAQTPLQKEAIEALTTRFSSALEASLTAWQAKHGGLILVKGAVVSGAVDITPEIQADIARQMQVTP
jgi:conjugal transfer pilin signal peptidase TrbI